MTNTDKWSESSHMDISPLTDQVNNNNSTDSSPNSSVKGTLDSPPDLDHAAKIGLLNSSDQTESDALDSADCVNRNVKPAMKDSKKTNVSVPRDLCFLSDNGARVRAGTDSELCGPMVCVDELASPVRMTITSYGHTLTLDVLSDRYLNMRLMEGVQASPREMEHDHCSKKCSDGEAEKTSSSSSSSEDSDSDSSSSSDSESDSSQSESSKSSSSSSDSSSTSSSSSSSESDSSDEEETKGDKLSNRKKKKRRR